MGFAGTSFTLIHQKVLSSSVGKEVNLLVTEDFPYLTVEDAWQYLSERLDLTGCEAVKESNEMKKLEGRPRLSGLTIQLLSTRKNQSDDKAQMLKDAIKESFAKHCKTIELLLRKFSTTHHIEVYETLKRLVIAFATDKSVVIRANADDTTQQFDLLESGICHIRRIANSPEHVFLIEEPLTITVVHDYIRENATKESQYTVMREYVNNLSAMRFSSGKGHAFEQLVAAALLQKDIMKALLSEITVYDRSGKTVDQVPPQLMNMQFHKFSNYKENPNIDPVFEGRSSIDLYNELLNGRANGEMYIGDDMMGPDIIGVAVVDDMKLSMHVSCKFIPKATTRADDTRSSDASLVSKYLWCSDRNAVEARRKFNAAKKTKTTDEGSKVEPKKQTKKTDDITENTNEEIEAESKKGGKKARIVKKKVPKSEPNKRKHNEIAEDTNPTLTEPKVSIRAKDFANLPETDKKGEFVLCPKPNATYDDHWTHFLTLREQVKMTLLIGCIFPSRAKTIEFPYETMDDKELLINVDASNMKLLFQDPVIVQVLTAILADKTPQQLCNDIKDKDHNKLRKLQFPLLPLQALFMQ
jgi:hypothetical protein